MTDCLCCLSSCVFVVGIFNVSILSVTFSNIVCATMLEQDIRYWGWRQRDQTLKIQLLKTIEQLLLNSLLLFFVRLGPHDIYCLVLISKVCSSPMISAIYYLMLFLMYFSFYITVLQPAIFILDNYVSRSPNYICHK